MTRLRAVFMGTPAFALPALEVVSQRCELVRVVSQPDRPAGRGGELTAPPVAAWARGAGVELAQPRAVRTPAWADELAALGADVAVVVAYGRILTPAVLAAFRLGCVNVHASLLPAYRGAAPVQRAILDGCAATGVSIMQLDAGLDTGPVFATRPVDIGATETSGELLGRLAPIGAALLGEVLEALALGTARAVAQPEQGASHAPPLTKADGAIDFAAPAARVAARIRGVDPWPGAVAHRGGAPLKLFGARLGPAVDAPPGVIVAIDADGAHVACGVGSVIVSELQAPGRKRLPAAVVASGRGVAVGDRLTPP